MMYKKIYYRWFSEFKCFEPTGLEPGEEHDWEKEYQLNQGIGVGVVAGFLSVDIQCCIDSIDQVINYLKDLASPNPVEDGDWGMGNAYWMLVTQDKVFIACEYVKRHQVLLSIDQMLHVLEQYRNFIVGDYKNPESVFEPIEVEIIAEGEEAVRQYEALEGAHDISYIGDSLKPKEKGSYKGKPVIKGHFLIGTKKENKEGLNELTEWLSDIPNKEGIFSPGRWIDLLNNLASSPVPDGNFIIRRAYKERVENDEKNNILSNSHWILITQGKVLIANEYREKERILLSVEQLLHFLHQYQNFLKEDYVYSKKYAQHYLI